MTSPPATISHGAHDARVDAICEQVRAVAAAGGPAHIHKGGVHHFVPLPGDGRFAGRAVDVSALTNVLEIDAERRVCVAEPGATFAGVVQETLRQGLVPKVVPELEGITLGGAVAGCSLESMSYRYGGFHDGCLEYEVVTGAGERRVLGPEDELFHMVHGSYGTLAILTKLTFELVPAKPFVKMTYRRHRDFESFHADLRERCSTGDYDFVDGIVHGPDELVLCLGEFVDEAPAVSSYRATRVYYKSTRRLKEDWLTTADYLFRYDTECHWLTRTVPPLEWGWVRRLVGRWFLGSTNLIRWSGRLAPVTSRVTRRPDVVVDLFIPDGRFGDFFEWYERSLDYWPLWVVPYRLPEPYPWINRDYAAGISDDLMIDVAIYGKRNNRRDVDWSEELERKTRELGGVKTLISRNHYTRERFWQVYDRERWTAAKRELDPGGLFDDLYEKFKPRD
jgi:FAD/FMN-containing dehydrogenase